MYQLFVATVFTRGFVKIIVLTDCCATTAVATTFTATSNFKLPFFKVTEDGSGPEG